MITDERVQAMAFEVAFARDWDCTIEKRHDLKDLIASALTTALEEERAKRHRCSGCDLRWEGDLTVAEMCGDCWRQHQALKKDRAQLETAIHCLPSFPGGSADPCDFWGVHMVGVEAVCALVRGEG